MNVVTIAFLIWFQGVPLAAALVKDTECIVNTEDNQQTCSTPNKSKAENVTIHTNTMPGQCRIYMAESSIPNAGIGIYTTTTIERGENIFQHPDIVIDLIDFVQSSMVSWLFTEEDSLDWKRAVNGKEDSDSYCVTWASAGECVLNRKFMQESCAKSCAVKEAGLDVIKILASRKSVHQECDRWAVEGECESNRPFMYDECGLACVTHEYGLKIDTEAFTKDFLPYHYLWESIVTNSTNEAAQVDVLSAGAGALVNAHDMLQNAQIANPKVGTSDLYRSSDVGAGAISDRQLHNQATELIPAGMEIFITYGAEWFVHREQNIGMSDIPSKPDYIEADQKINEFFERIEKSGKKVGDAETVKMYEEFKSTMTKPKVKMIIPEAVMDAESASRLGTALQSMMPNVIRSPEWLEENGYCLDNLRPGVSTIREAGNGAFAARSLPKGQIIAPLPLLQMDRKHMRVFREDIETNKQLILNYVYGHKDSSLLLFPYSHTVNYVNNNVDKSKVNAVVQWSPSSFHNKSWEDDDVEEILKRGRGLMLELIATSDIMEGEEIFLDYGARWDEAWDNHVRNWVPPKGDDYTPVQLLAIQEEIRTEDEQKDDPYPGNVVLMCTAKSGFTDAFNKQTLELSWNQYSFDTEDDEWRDAVKNGVFPCNILERYQNPNGAKNETLYRVQFVGNEIFSLRDVPRRAITFADKKYTSNLHLETAFRHEIHIPDAIFPKKWMNLKKM